VRGGNGFGAREKGHPAIRLSSDHHNVGDTLVSLAPALAGTLPLLTGRAAFDPIFALAIDVTMIVRARM
jgi:divalent metal cation (Fe/Co/Zn/Cd) transporter